MHELHTYTDSDFADLSSLMRELSGNIVFTRESLDRMLAEAAQMNVDCIHLTSNPKREAANALYQKMGFEKKETNCYVMKMKD